MATKPTHVQVRNPRTKKYVKISCRTKRIVANNDKPFKDVPMLKKRNAQKA